MKIQKRITFLCFLISILSLIVAFHFAQQDNYYSFINSIFIGIFSSSLLASFISLITYFEERKKTIYDFYSGCHHFLVSLTFNSKLGNKIDVYDLQKNFANSIDTYNNEIYLPYRQISFFLKKSKKSKLTSDIIKIMACIYLRIVDDNRFLQLFILEEKSRDELDNYIWKCVDNDCVNLVIEVSSKLDQLKDYLFGKTDKEDNNNAD